MFKVNEEDEDLIRDDEPTQKGCWHSFTNCVGGEKRYLLFLKRASFTTDYFFVVQECGPLVKWRPLMIVRFLSGRPSENSSCTAYSWWSSAFVSFASIFEIIFVGTANAETRNL